MMTDFLTDFLTTFLASILHEQGVEGSSTVAKRVADDLHKARLVSQRDVKWAAIQNDPCSDCKVLMRKYKVTMSFVYRAWRAKLLLDNAARRAKPEKVCA